MANPQVLETKDKKILKSQNYNFVLDKNTGFFVRWGRNKADDPAYSQHGAEILDLEISSGKCMGNCPECYKCNGIDQKLENMTFKQFQNIFHKVANTKLVEIGGGYGEWKNTSPLTQIAFGICDIGSNPDFFRMMIYARHFGIIPNYTCHGLDMNEEYARLSAKICGAVAVSLYNKDKTYNAIKMLSDAGLTQVNIHYVLHDKSYQKAFSVIDDIATDERLKGLKAIVFLKYKPKGNGIGKFNQVNISQYRELIEYANLKGVNIGFDSCSAHSYLKVIEGQPNYDQLVQYVEPCESSCFSSYINHKGEFYACSFCEGEGMWKEGISVLDANNFVEDVWMADKTNTFRELLLSKNRKCPMYKIDEAV